LHYIRTNFFKELFLKKFSQKRTFLKKFNQNELSKKFILNELQNETKQQSKTKTNLNGIRF